MATKKAAAKKAPATRKRNPAGLGITWTEIQDKLYTANEAQVLAMLERELTSPSLRAQHRLRIYGRYNVLRAERERAVLMTSDASKLLTKLKQK